MNELFSSSMSSGVPLTCDRRPPIEFPASARLVTSLVETKPPEGNNGFWAVASSLNTEPLAEMTVASPPPPSLPGWLLLHTAGVELTYAPKLPPPWPNHTPALSGVAPPHPVGVPAVHRSKSLS